MSDESLKPWLQEGAPSGLSRLLESAAEDGPSPEALGRLSARLAAAGLFAPPGGGGGGGGDGGPAQHGGPAGQSGAPVQGGAGTHAAASAASKAAVAAKPLALGAKAILLGTVGAAAIGVGAFQAGRVVERRAQEERAAREVKPPVVATPPAPVAEAEPPVPEPVVPQAVVPEPAPVKPAVRPALHPREEVNPDQEAALLTRALAASGQKDWAHALEAAQEHARRFPHGSLAQEREMIAIEALVGLSRTDEAKRRAEAFRKQWPTSTHLVRLNTLVPP